MENTKLATVVADFWTTKDLANRWVISERQVRDMAAAREIPALRVGKLWRFPVTRIEAWERSNQR
ncbi:excisionase family DNA binding protein [Rhodococcus wratislaviensis]|uniref:helix-turn-helix domain-containing protein n=1 Tax=Rhodococcus wratislaviensis TaxID=44752 RepID=UPI000DD3D542|nr:excisionase family DNA binding protein [Rhodococcus wratislaviensis]